MKKDSRNDDDQIYNPIGFIIKVITLLIDCILWVVNYFKTKNTKLK